MDVTSDLSQNIVHTIYLTFAHNYILLAYLIGLAISVMMALKKPSRYATLLILGFAILAFSFEYDKHIIDGLREQTINSLITVQQHNKVQKLTTTLITDVAPLVFYIGGWVVLFIAIFLGNKNQKTKE
jgi:hypothetical protein